MLPHVKIGLAESRCLNATDFLYFYFCLNKKLKHTKSILLSFRFFFRKHNMKDHSESQHANAALTNILLKLSFPSFLLSILQNLFPFPLKFGTRATISTIIVFEFLVFNVIRARRAWRSISFSFLCHCENQDFAFVKAVPITKTEIFSQRRLRTKTNLKSKIDSSDSDDLN